MCSSMLLIFSLLTFFVSGQTSKFVRETPEEIKDSATVTKDWEQLDQVLKNLVGHGIKAILPTLIGTMQNKSISASCIRDVMHIIGGMRHLDTWALRFFDSSAKGIDGLITGTMFSYGAFEECIDTVAFNQHSGKHQGEMMFTGKYCTLQIKPSLPPKKPFYKMDEIMDELKTMRNGSLLGHAAKLAPYFYKFPLRLGLCIPSGCSENDVNQMLTGVANYTTLYMKVKRCEVKGEHIFTPVAIFVMCLYSSAGFLMLIGTITDAYCRYSGIQLNTSIRILLAFSLFSNFRKFIDTSTASKSMSCLNGIRFLSMSWIILGHSYVMKIHHLAGGLEYIKTRMQAFAPQVIANGFLAVDTFFFLGGLLTCYVIIKFVKIGNKPFNVKVYLIHRVWRILPVYFFVLMYAFIIDLTVSSPTAYETLEHYVGGCKDNWWANILFINNFYRPSDMCMQHTWYLSLDMQFHIAALIVLLPLLRWPKIGIIIAAVITVCSVFACCVITYMNNFPPTFLMASSNMEQTEVFTTEFYVKPYSHVGPYIIGLMTGYFLAMNPNIKISRAVRIIGWLVALVLAMSITYGILEWNAGRQPIIWESVFYGGCHRLAWTLSVSWMVITCAAGYGGIVNYILSWKVWVPLGRLTFVAYLVHPLVQISIIIALRGPLHPVHAIAVWLNFGHLMATYGVAFAVSILVESPFLSLEKLVFHGSENTESKKATKDGNVASDIEAVSKH